jgi:hypothetical protein
VRRAVSALVTLAVAAGGVGAACQIPAQPTPPATIYGELVEGGCYAANDAGLYWVTQEVNEPAPPAWVGCMREGGSVVACGTPCTPRP